MSIRDMAREELVKTDYSREEKDSYLTILDIFFSTWDSGGAVFHAIPILNRLLQGLPLTPLTGEPDEWFQPDPSDMFMRQNSRCPQAFRTLRDIPHLRLKAGDAYYLHNDNRIEKIPSFPWSPPTQMNIASPEIEVPTID